MVGGGNIDTGSINRKCYRISDVFLFARDWTAPGGIGRDRSFASSGQPRDGEFGPCAGNQGWRRDPFGWGECL
jgi:hypothetical protein